MSESVNFKPWWSIKGCSALWHYLNPSWIITNKIKENNIQWYSMRQKDHFVMTTLRSSYIYFNQDGWSSTTEYLVQQPVLLYMWEPDPCFPGLQPGDLVLPSMVYKEMSWRVGYIISSSTADFISSPPDLLTHTMWCQYNMVNFLPNLHNKCLITHLWGWDMGRLL